MQSSEFLLLIAIAATPALAASATLRGGDEVAPKVCLPKHAVPGSTADQKCGHAASFLAGFAQTGQPGYDPYPEDPAPFDYAERLSKKCKEPKNRPHSFNGAGPPVIYCCHTAQEKVAEFEERQSHCDEDDLPVPCWKTLVKAIPTYLMYYRSRVADLCGTTTTTTTSTNATNDTKAVEQESIVKNVTGDVNSSDSLAEDFVAFCLRKCDQMSEKEKSDCEGFCKVLGERHEEEVEEVEDETKAEQCGGHAEGSKKEAKEDGNGTAKEKGNGTTAGNDTK